MRPETGQSRATRGKTSSTALESAEKRAEIVKLRRAGWLMGDIAEHVGLAGPSGVAYHLDAYYADLKPSAELAESWRQNRLERAEERFKRLQPKAMGKQDEQTGEWLVEPDYQAWAVIQRDEDSLSKMLGANLQVDAHFAIGVGTREWLAELLNPADEAIEVTAVELLNDEAARLGDE
jgi:hypothetical protein